MSKTMERALKLKERLRNGETVFGAWHTIPEISAVEVMVEVGFDFILIDAEHSPWTIEKLQQAVIAFRGSETVPMVRVPYNEPVFIKQALDVGIEGIMAPTIRSASDVRELVAACRYPPQGIRGFGPRRASRYYLDIEDYVARVNEATFVIAQIEDYRAADEIDEILDVEGLDVVAYGPNDLSGTMGLPRQLNHPDFQKTLDRILERCKARGIPSCNGLTVDANSQAVWIEKGSRMVIVCQDSGVLLDESRRVLAKARTVASTSGLLDEPLITKTGY